MLKSREDAEDALQEVFLRLWKKRDKLDEVINMEAYAMRMTKNLCLDKLKGAVKSIDLADQEYKLEYAEATPYKRIELADSMQHMRKVLEQLPDLQKTIIFLRDVEGYTFEEIAEVTGVKVNALRVTLSRARKNARALYLKLNDYECN